MLFFSTGFGGKSRDVVRLCIRVSAELLKMTLKASHVFKCVHLFWEGVLCTPHACCGGSRCGQEGAQRAGGVSDAFECLEPSTDISGLTWWQSLGPRCTRGFIRHD